MLHSTSLDFLIFFFFLWFEGRALMVSVTILFSGMFVFGFLHGIEAINNAE